VGHHWLSADGLPARLRAGLSRQDIIGYLPMDCPPDSAPGYLAKMFREYPREDVNRMLDAMDALNAQPAQAAMEAAIAEVLDGADPSGTAKRGRGRPRKNS